MQIQKERRGGKNTHESCFQCQCLFQVCLQKKTTRSLLHPAVRAGEGDWCNRRQVKWEIILILTKIINTLCYSEYSKSLPTCVKANRVREKPTKKALLLEIFSWVTPLGNSLISSKNHFKYVKLLMQYAWNTSRLLNLCCQLPPCYISCAAGNRSNASAM